VIDHAIALRTAGQAPVAFRWNEVRVVVTCKRDFMMYDDIRLAFRTAYGWVEVSEESAGWRALAEAMALHLPGNPAEW
jgi:hypothetical protein